VRGVLTGVMLVSLLMAAALPGAFGEDGMLFAISYVTLQVGRNVAAVGLLGRDQRLRDVVERLVGWSAASGVLWLAVAAILVLLVPAGSQVTAPALSAVVAALLGALALWELRAPGHGVLLRHLQHQQQEGTT
jgi:low temperature requirement protein LtrA